MTIKKDILNVQGLEISIFTEDFKNEYISLTDMARYRNGDDPRYVIQNWMRNKDTLEFLATWEFLHNPDFNRVQFDAVRSEAGTNRFVMTPSRWVESTSARGIVSKSGRYGGGTYAHADIAMEFASWLSPAFKLYVMKDYRRLKYDESSRLSLELNVVLFGTTARQWRMDNPGKKGNIRDYATIQQLLVLSNLESYNAILISQGQNQKERMQALRQVAVSQLKVLTSMSMTNLPEIKQ